MEVLGHFIAETGLFYASGHNCPVIAANADRPTKSQFVRFGFSSAFPRGKKKEIILARTVSTVERLTASWTYTSGLWLHNRNDRCKTVG